jgi:hypothetical protein
MADADATDERLARAWCLPCNCLHTVAQHDIVYTCEVGGGGTVCCRYAQVLNVDKHRVRLRYWRIDLTTRPDDQVLGQGTCLTMAPSPIGEWSQCFDVRVEQLACIMLHVAHRVTTSLDIPIAIHLTAEACIHEIMEHRSGQVRVYVDGGLRSAVVPAKLESDVPAEAVRATKIDATSVPTTASTTASAVPAASVHATVESTEPANATATVTGGTCKHTLMCESMPMDHDTFVEALFSTYSYKFVAHTNRTGNLSFGISMRNQRGVPWGRARASGREQLLPGPQSECV